MAFYLINLFTTPVSATTLGGCGCNVTGCNFYEFAEVACCPAGEPNTYVDSYEVANCNDPDGFCSKWEYTESPFYCLHSSGTDAGCYGHYLDACLVSQCTSSEICGNGLDDDCNGLIDDGCNSGGTGEPGGSGCTTYYWVYYYSYDGGATWIYQYSIYAGCW